jgi:hypothetical protein
MPAGSADAWRAGACQCAAAAATAASSTRTRSLADNQQSDCKKYNLNDAVLELRAQAVCKPLLPKMLKGDG